MSKLLKNDITGEVMTEEEAWHVQVKSPTKITKEFDCAWTDIKPLFVESVRKLDWFKLKKGEDGKWQKVKVENDQQEAD